MISRQAKSPGAPTAAHASTRLADRLKKGLKGLSYLLYLALLVAFAELFVRLAVDVRIIGPNFAEFDPCFLKSLKQDFRCVRKTPEFTMTLSTNAMRMRGPDPDPDPDVDPWRSVLFAGDSFTMGYGVNDGEEFPSLLNERLNARSGKTRPIQVWNIGLGNSGTARLLRYLEENPYSLNPDVIVLQLSRNDFTDNAIEALYSLDDNAALVRHAAPTRPGTLSRVQKVVESIPHLVDLHILGLVRDAVYIARDAGRADRTNPAEQRRLNRLTYKLVEAVIARLRTLGSKVIAVTFDISGERLAVLEDIFARSGTVHIRLPNQSEHPEYYYRIDQHWTVAGHQQAADRLEPVLFDMLVNLLVKPAEG